jgi:NAD(P)H-nitrite reductase large subunit
LRPVGEKGTVQGSETFRAGQVIGDIVDLDAKVCYCFHVSQRKLLNFIRQTRPKVPSQLSDCGGAGTGCGWCIPFLKQLHRQAVEGGVTDLEQLTPAEYERLRAQYIRAGKGTPPPGATPLPEDV